MRPLLRQASTEPPTTNLLDGSHLAAGGWRSARRSFLVFFTVSFVLAWRNIWVLDAFSDPSSWITVHLRELCIWMSWWLFLPLIQWAARTYPLISLPTASGRLSRLRNFAVHLGLAIALGGSSLLIIFILDATVWNLPLPGGPGPESSWQEWLPRAWAVNLITPVLYYSIISAYCHATLASRRARALELRAASLRASLSESRLDALRSRLEPHFLFNTLNAISALVGRDPPRARRAMARLSDLLRDVLSTDARHEVSLDQELDDARRYLDLLALRFGDRLRLEVEIGPSAGAMTVPRLILQPLLENAVRHGIEKRRLAGHLRIRAHCQEENLHLQVIDDGPGPPDEIYEGEGLLLTRRRLHALYGPDATFELKPLAEIGGASATVTLPCRPYLPGREPAANPAPPSKTPAP